MPPAPVPLTAWASARAEKTGSEILPHVLQRSHRHATLRLLCAHRAARLPRLQWEHQEPLQLPAHPGSQLMPRQSQISCAPPADGALSQLPNCQGSHHGCHTTSPFLTKKPAPERPRGPSHTTRPKPPSLSHRRQFSFCSLLTPKPPVTAAGLRVICVF